MAGGRGERFWPVSREKTPKQLITLLGEKSFLQQAVERVLPLVPLKNIFIITNEAQAAGSPQATAQTAEGKRHRRTGRTRHLRRRHAGRGARRRAFHHGRHGGAAGRPRHSRGEKISAGADRCLRSGRAAARPLSPSASSRPSRPRVMATFASANRCRRRKA